jgi:riboflavin synthase
MFSAIVKEIGTVKNIESKNGLLEVSISSKDLISELKLGDSIAIDGCCLTIVEVTQSYFKIQATQETLTKTNLSKLKVDSKVNIEAPLKIGDQIGGHLVLGHVDATGEVIDIKNAGENEMVKILFPKELNSFIAPKGSISVNGVSLTVVESKNNIFSFTLIPFTRDNTNLGLIKTGDLVNLEIDLISRYLVNYIENNKEFFTKHQYATRN